MRAFEVLILCVQAALVLSDNSTHPCPTSQTCCESPFPGVVGYCPSPNAVCCSDKLHCCPQNAVCNLTQGTCDKQDQLIPFSFRNREDIPDSKLQAVENDTINIVYCPDRRYTCQDGNTCCTSPSGRFSCCPYASASCCHDGLHCCPHGTSCDSTSRHCLQADSLKAVAPKQKTVPFSFQEREDIPASKLQAVENEVADTDNKVYCLDRRYWCPDGNTCCSSPTGMYSCCQYASASCCRDGFHCCPNGMRCDSTSRHCQRADILQVLAPKLKTVPFSIREREDITASKLQAVENEVADTVYRVYCPDRRSYCQDGYTCCTSPTGKFSCCPLTSGSCCPDGNHCCPHGMRCDSTSRHCQRADILQAVAPKQKSVQFSSREREDIPDSKLQAVENEVADTVNRVYCPGHRYYCQDGNTCCTSPSGQFSCCPYASASCCPDGRHCCPHGTRCDSTSRHCLQADSLKAVAPKQLRTPAIPLPVH